LWLDDKSPVIALSMRFDRIDNFWFVLRHELEHVLRLLPMRLFTRLTNAFSKKRVRQTLRVTPAMAAGVTDRGWEVIDIVKLLDELPRSRTLGILTTEKRLGIIRANHQGVL